MEVTDEQKRDLARRMLEIMETMEEALQHMQVQLDDLQLEAGKELFGDFTTATVRLMEMLPEFLLVERKDQLVEALKSFRDALSGMQDAFVGGELPKMQQELAQVLLPVFMAWRDEARQHLLPWASM